ncbi:MAG: diaminopimelate epimerase [Candidatus Brocadiia bacterium]
MDQRIDFTKLSGSGNDFICIDNRDGRLDGLLADEGAAGRLARALCRRGLGVGADGVVFALAAGDPSAADFAVRFFEPDGSEAELCGNGSACFTRWVIEEGWLAGQEVRIETPSGEARGRVGRDGYVQVCIPVPRELATDIEVEAEGRRWRMDYALTGVPHAVVYVDDVEGVDVARWGAALRRHPRFGPRGVNVNFTQVLGEGRLAVRTFEFGVEGETLACGTGSATAGLMAALRFGWPASYLREGDPVRVRVRGGDTLRVYYLVHPDGAIERVCLHTVVRYLYRGRLHPDLAARALAGALELEPAAAGA